MSSHQAPARFNHNTAICVCMCALKNYHCEPCHFIVEHLKQNDVQDKKFKIEHHIWPERCQEGRGRGMRKSKRRKREFLMNQVGFRQGLFSFWCILLHTWVLWSCVFSAFVRHQKHHISVIFNITHNMYTFLEIRESWLVLKPQNGLFSRPYNFTKDFVAG